MIKGITIHNSHNEFSAKENMKMINNLHLNKYHYLVDELEIIQLFEDNEVVYHTGKGYDEGNLSTISICICRSTVSLYEDAEKKAVELVKTLLKKYHLDLSGIFFHSDWNMVSYCPHRTLDLYKTKKNWIERNFKYVE